METSASAFRKGACKFSGVSSLVAEDWHKASRQLYRSIPSSAAKYAPYI